MLHWIDDLSDIEENTVNPKAALGDLAFNRARQCIENSLTIYNARHATGPIKPIIDGDSEVKSITIVRKPHRGGFEFSVKDGHFITVHEPGKDPAKMEVTIGEDKRMMLVKDTMCRLDEKVDSVLRGVLFWDLKATLPDRR